MAILASRTKNDIFNEFKQMNLSRTIYPLVGGWENYWLDLHRPLVDFYQLNGFHVFPIPRNSKRPYFDSKWTSCEEHIHGTDELLARISRGENLALHLGHSKIIAVDIDNPTEFDYNRFTELAKYTTTIKTPNGLCFLTLEPYDRELTDEYYSVMEKHGADTVRHHEMYVLLPYSQTCIHDKEEHPVGCHHEYRIREFLSMKRIESYQIFVLRLLRVIGWRPR